MPRERKHGFGFQGAPHVEALVMVGYRIGFRFGVGIRYLPGFALDTGNELQIAIVPEVVGEVSRNRYGFAHFFNAVVVGATPSAIRERQRPTLDACSGLRGVADVHCSSWTSTPFFSLGLDVGLLERFSGIGVRYGVGFQGTINQHHAVANGYSGNDPDDSDDSLYVTYAIEGARGVVFAGVEW